jgi:nucleotide-binding universal stress UspA family protein
MKIAAAIDFSATSERVLQTIKAYATALQAMVYLIHVEPPDSAIPGYEAGMVDPETAQAVTESREEQLKQAAKSIEAAGLRTVTVLLKGPIAETLLAEAERIGIDLIIAGSHGHGALYHMLVGSVSEGILRRAKVPVMIVPVDR